MNIIIDIICINCKEKIKNKNNLETCKKCYSPLCCSKECLKKHIDVSHNVEYCNNYLKEMIIQYKQIILLNSFWKFDIINNNDNGDDIEINKLIFEICPSKFEEQYKKNININILHNWKDLYNYYKLELNNPISRNINIIMTIYYILIKYLKIIPNFNNNNDIIIHLIGIDSIEINAIINHTFHILLYLLPGYNFYIIGFDLHKMKQTKNMKNITETNTFIYNYKNELTKNLLCIEIIPLLYSQINIKNKIKPNIIIGLNAGLSSYPKEWSI
ncbi:hypothetical protein RFI_28558, partial [Reticulomyxa filosa]